MEGSGICTACGASAEVNEKQECSDCAGGSMESQPLDEETAPADGEADQADGDDEADA